LDLLDDANEISGIGEVPVVENQPGILFVGILVKVINSLGVETTCTPFDAMHHIALFKE